MPKISADVDIDFPDRDLLLSKLRHVVASRIEKGKQIKHNTGVYFQDIPVNPLTNEAAIDYKTAEDRGYFKFDMLNVSAYQGIKNEEHIIQLLNKEPYWELLYEKDVCDQLVHVNGYHDLIAMLQPKSIEELAAVLALIRPGKKHLVGKCIHNGFDSIKDEIWVKTEAYSFKKSHGVAYAHLVIMQLNLLIENLQAGS